MLAEEQGLLHEAYSNIERGQADATSRAHTGSMIELVMEQEVMGLKARLTQLEEALVGKGYVGEDELLGEHVKAKILTILG